MKEDNLLFIASQPRAGSTYLQNLLSNNPLTNTVSEPWIMLALAPLFKPELIQAKYDYKLTTDAFVEYQEKVGVIDFSSTIKRLALEQYEPLFEGYQRVIDKTPRYWEILDELVELFPESKILIIRRNPIDVVKSMITTWNIPSIERLNYFRRDILLAPKVLKDFESKYQGNNQIRSVYYHDLIEQTKETVSALYDWMKVPYNEHYLDTSNNEKYKGKYGDPYQNSKDKKEKQLQPHFVDFIKGYAHWLDNEVVEEFGIHRQGTYTTNSFKYFMNLGEGRTSSSFQDLKREISLAVKKKRIK